MAQKTDKYQAKNNIRIVTASSLFDGHDVSINIMRRILQATGAEVIHLGHNRSVQEVVDCAIQEDVQAIAMTSYQGGHVEYLKYMYDLLKEKGAEIKIFAGGGGTILPEEKQELEAYGIAKIYSPDEGRQLGLQGMINDLLASCDFPTVKEQPQVKKNIPLEILPKVISAIEEGKYDVQNLTLKQVPILGVTGTGGAGKSSLLDELIRRWLMFLPNKKLAIISIDPTKKRSGGALLGDRIRMNAIHHPNIYMRSVATRQANMAISKEIENIIKACRAAPFDLIIVETSGIGQSDTSISDFVDMSMYVMTPEYGAATQLEKIDMLDFADLVVINKFDKPGAQDALRDVKKQFRRNRELWEISDDELPVFGTVASQFNDGGVNKLFLKFIELLSANTSFNYKVEDIALATNIRQSIIPREKERYLEEIADYNRQYRAFVKQQADIATKMYQLKGAIELVDEKDVSKTLEDKYKKLEADLSKEALRVIEKWPRLKEKYYSDSYAYKVRDATLKIDTKVTSLSGLKIPKVALPHYHDWGDIVYWRFMENLPGKFPFSAGVFPFRRTAEDPTRMFAGEGGPERTNKRFHYLSNNQPAKRLSTAFDSVTLYGENPDKRPDIYGKIGNSGVNVATLDDAKKLYSGINLCDKTTSVSMTINGPAPMILAFFLNAAIDQQCELYIKENGLEGKVKKKIEAIFKEKGLAVPGFYGTPAKGHNGLGLMLLGVTGDQVLDKETYQEIKSYTLSNVRGTVQADILKEDQAQNTCIFSTEFALKMMGDVQEHFINNKVRNFYSVSISGYHIAEAGANPITQLAFTLSNGFTYVEYYLSKGMHIDEFAPNLSFFFSNGMDPEYAVMGRVARRIWAKAIKHRYGGNERSQKLKYHIQTSGRSLHAQEIAFNDIRTTLQALYAIYDNCNSLHTNAYDEAITTPTEESVRRAMAIQLVINKELGLNNNENPLQGSFIIEELTDLVEEAVLVEFERISERGGVLGAMERMYQRSKIQDESMYYEHKKHTGELPIVGVNTFLGKEGSPTIMPNEVIRSSKAERDNQIKALNAFHKAHADNSEALLKDLQQAAMKGENIFNELMEVAKYCSLGQMTNALYDVGGKYRRSM